MLTESRKTGLLRLRHLQEHTEAHAEDMADERERFARLQSDESKPRAVSAFNLFQTPEPIADLMAARLGQRSRVLEPSAGLGRLYRALRHRSDCPCVLVEQSPDCFAELYRQTERDAAAQIIPGDFLAVEGLGTFDGILMNPPFKRGRDIAHIRHAATLLDRGGRLVALCYDGVRQNRDLRPICTTWEPLPAGSFVESGTRAGVVLLTIDA